MPRSQKFDLIEACRECGFDEAVILHYIEERWLEPAEQVEENWMFDDEDLARARLILELQSEFGVNDEAVPIILHLVDQLNAIRKLVKRVA